MLTLDDVVAEADLPQPGSAPPPPPGSVGRPKVQLQGSAPATSTASKAASKKPGFLEQIGNALALGQQGVNEANAAQVQANAKVMASLGAGAVRAPGVALGGAIDSLTDAGKFAADNIDAAFARKPGTTFNKVLGGLAKASDLVNAGKPADAALATTLLSAAKVRGSTGASLSDVLSARKTLGQVGLPGVNQMTAQGVAIGASLIGGPEGAMAKGAVPLASRVARLLGSSAKVGVATAVTADAKNAPERAVQGAEGAAVNFAAEPLLGVLHNYISSKPPTKIVKGTPTDALGDKLDRAFASARTQEAAYQAQEKALKSPDEPQPLEPQSAIQSGTRHTDGPSPESQDSGGDGQGGPRKGGPGTAQDGTGQAAPPEVTERYRDANEAIKAAGGSETVAPETHPIGPDGRILVDANTKAALDDAGMGRAFAANNESPLNDQVIYREEDPQGGSRVVGVIDKDSLAAFKDEVDHYRYDQPDAGPLDTTSAHPVGQWKLSNLGAPYDVAPFLRALSDELPSRTKLTDAEVMATAKATADAIGQTPEDVLAYAANIASDTSKLPQVMATIRTVYARVASQVDAMTDLHTDWSQLADDHPDLRDTLAAVHNVITLGQSVAETKSGVGGALRMAGMPDADAYLESFGKVPQAQLKPVDPLDGLPKLPRTKEELKQWMDAWEYTKDDPAAREAFIKGLTFLPGKWKYLRTSFANFFTASLISAPATFGRDLLGPATIGLLRTIERTAGGYAAALSPLVPASAKADLLAAASQAPLAYVQTLGDMQIAFKAALKSTLQGRQVLQAKDLYDLQAKGIPQPLIDAAVGANPGLSGQIPYVMGNAVNLWPQVIHALHGGVNEFAQRLSYLGEVRAAGMLEAAQQGLTGQDATAYVRQRLLNSTDEVTWGAHDPEALASSQRTTLIKAVADADTQPVIKAFTNAVTKLRTNVPESRYILPIFTVPANAIGEGLRRVPLLGQMFRETQMELSGSLGTARQAEAYGRALSGASLLLGGVLMARAGLITGAGPTEPNARKLWLASGYQPYSIKIGDTWVSYNRLDVVGSLLAIPAMFYDKSVHTQMDSQSAVFASVAAMAQYFKDQAALQGVSDLLSFGGSPGESENLLQRIENQTISGFIPNFITQLGRNNIDPESRIARTPFEAVLNKLPGASLLLDPQRNLLGEPTDKIMNAGFNTLPISMSNMNTYAKDPVLDELSRLYVESGYAPGVLSPALPGGKEDMRDIKLSDGHSLYDLMMRQRLTAQVDGQTLREALKDLHDSPEYNDAVDGTAKDADDGTDSRVTMNEKVFAKFNKQAKQDAALASPEAATYLAIGLAKQANTDKLRDDSTRAIAQNPSLLTSLGINLQDYVDKVTGYQ